MGTENFQKAMEKYNAYDLNHIVYYGTPQAAIKDANIFFIFTEWAEVKAMQPEEMCIRDSWQVYREYLGYGVMRSGWYFAQYAVNGVRKYKKGQCRCGEC